MTRSPQCFQLQQLLPGPFGLGLVKDFLPLKTSASLLLQPLCFMPEMWGKENGVREGENRRSEWAGQRFIHLKDCKIFAALLSWV